MFHGIRKAPSEYRYLLTLAMDGLGAGDVELIAARKESSERRTISAGKWLESRYLVSYKGRGGSRARCENSLLALIRLPPFVCQFGS